MLRHGYDQLSAIKPAHGACQGDRFGTLADAMNCFVAITGETDGLRRCYRSIVLTGATSGAPRY